MKTPGAQTIVFHRLANWGQMPGATRAGAAILSRVGRAGLLLARNDYGIELPAETTVGRRVKLAHQSGIVIHRDAVIGKDVVIRQNVTIGLRGDVEGDQAAHVPQLADGATSAPGLCSSGPSTSGRRPPSLPMPWSPTMSRVAAGRSLPARRSRMPTPCRGESTDR